MLRQIFGRIPFNSKLLKNIESINAVILKVGKTVIPFYSLDKAILVAKGYVSESIINAYYKKLYYEAARGAFRRHFQLGHRDPSAENVKSRVENQIIVNAHKIE